MGYTRRNMLHTMAAITGTSILSLDGEAKEEPVKKGPFAPNNGPEDLDEFLNLLDFEKKAEGLMSKMAYEYVASGAADENTLKWNREALDRIKMQTHVLNDVSKIDTKVSVLGQDLAYPILIAPSAFHKIMHPEGEMATARGAGMASTTYVVSSFTTTPIDEIAKVATQPLWFQLYLVHDKSFVKDLIQKVEAQGIKALCVTVDTPVTGARNRQERIKFKLPAELNAPYMVSISAIPGQPLQLSVTWKDIEWLKSIAKIPILLKGILNPDDAEQAVKAGVSGIIVSNHGARNLDTVPATIEVLPYITQRVNKKIPVLVDGGVRRGTDVVKAIALGANAVLIGRPICYGLACGGAEGVAKVLDILQKELRLAMALTGSASIAGIDRSFIWKGK
jgi:4-hydroxymandelate oxidase